MEAFCKRRVRLACEPVGDNDGGTWPLSGRQFEDVLEDAVDVRPARGAELPGGKVAGGSRMHDRRKHMNRAKSAPAIGQKRLRHGRHLLGDRSRHVEVHERLPVVAAGRALQPCGRAVDQRVAERDLPRLVRAVVPVREKRGRLAHHLAHGAAAHLLLAGYCRLPHEASNAATQTGGGIGLCAETVFALLRAEVLPLERTVGAGPFGDDLVDQVLHLLAHRPCRRP